MTTLQLAKVMKRKLADDEAKKMAEYWEEHQELTEEQVIEHFEKEFDTPITRAALLNAMMAWGL